MRRRGIALMACLAGTAWAQATRTWVSGVGSDTYPCSRTAPCATLAGALAATAPGGEVDVLDPVDLGPATLTFAVTVDGRGPRGEPIATVDGVTIAAGAADTVTLRGLRVTPQANGNGITFTSGAALHVENSTVSDFTGYGISFRPSAGGRLFVKDVGVRNCGAAGIYVASDGTAPGLAILSGTQLTGNVAGVQADLGGKVTVYDSNASLNANAGAWASGGGELNLEGVALTQNAVGALSDGATGPSLVRLSKTLITDNAAAPTGVTGIARVMSYGNNRIVPGPVAACQAGAVSVGPNLLPVGTVGTALTPLPFVGLGAMGGASFTQSGTLPDGVSFANGALSGTPTQAGVFTFTVSVTDGDHCTGSTPYQWTILPASSRSGAPDAGPGTPGVKKGCGCTTAEPFAALWPLVLLAFRPARGRWRRTRGRSARPPCPW